MSPKKTVFVVGAGASKEANLPTGGELKRQLAKLLDIRFEGLNERASGDEEIYRAIMEKSRDEHRNRLNLDPYLQAAWKIHDAMPLAISLCFWASPFTR